MTTAGPRRSRARPAPHLRLSPVATGLPRRLRNSHLPAPQAGSFTTPALSVACHDHIEGLTLRTYNPESHQWRLYWANSNDGLLVVPQIGEFKDGVGEFCAQDIFNGKSILIRFIWSKTNSDTPHFEQSFSADGGKSWEVNWFSETSR